MKHNTRTTGANTRETGATTRKSGATTRKTSANPNNVTTGILREARVYETSVFWGERALFAKIVGPSPEQLFSFSVTHTHTHLRNNGMVQLAGYIMETPTTKSQLKNGQNTKSLRSRTMEVWVKHGNPNHEKPTKNCQHNKDLRGRMAGSATKCEHLQAPRAGRIRCSARYPGKTLERTKCVAKR